MGHFQYECPKWNKEANYAELNEEEELLLMAYVEENEAKRKGSWFLDSGCSNHMCRDKGMFSNMVEGHNHSVKCGNNSRMIVAGKGSVRLMFNGTTFPCSGCILCPRASKQSVKCRAVAGKGTYHSYKKWGMQYISSVQRVDSAYEHECQSDVYSVE